MSEHSMPVRVRFAPSPTGYLHIGGARTALFNWLFARKHKGTFILRIEDTDQKRYIEDSEQDIMDSLRWLGLEWDEGPDKDGDYGPYRQSERLDLYQEWVNWLLDHGHAYRCDCSSERLKEMRENQRKTKQKPGYNRHCRDLDLGDDIGAHVVRFKMPVEGETTVLDLMRGDIVFQNSNLQDLVLMKSDGYPTYHLANVVDDHFMKISHIMRADEWIATAPLHWQLYKAFGWTMPQIAHLPVILSPSGKGKLSKRDKAFQDGNVKVLVQIREALDAGYLPEAMVNFLTNIGWAYGDDTEVFTPEAAMERFALEDINPAGGRLPYSKLEWLNGVYIRDLSTEEFAARITPYLEAAGLRVDSRLDKLTHLIQERIKSLPEVTDMIGFIFRDSITIDDPKLLIPKKMDAKATIKALTASAETLEGLTDFSPGSQESVMRELASKLELKAGQLFGAVRVAVTGQKVSPPLFETMEIIGQETCIKRIKAASLLLE